jgi:predicted glutamine amidotransferase
MARLFGFIGNRAELGPLMLSANAAELVSRRTSEEPVGWGVGFYQFGEVLLRRRPLETRAEIDISKFAENLRADVMIGHVRHPTVGNLRTENTHPFRYRQWLFAQIGTLDSFDRLRERLLDVQPGFLRPNVRGDTDSELIFYLFLSCLHDQGHLDDTGVTALQIRAAIREALQIVDRLCDEVGVPCHVGDALITNGDYLVGVHRSGKMAYRLVDTSEDVQSMLALDSAEPARLANLDKARCCVVASELPELPVGWSRVAPNSLVTLSRTEGPTFEALGSDASRSSLVS